MFGTQDKERGYPSSVMRRIEADFKKQRQDWTAKFDMYVNQLISHGDVMTPQGIIRYASQLADEREQMLSERYPEEIAG